MADVRNYRNNRNSFIRIPSNLFDYNEIKKLNDEEFKSYLKLLFSSNIIIGKDVAIKIYEFNEVDKYEYIKKAIGIERKIIVYLDALNLIDFQGEYLIVNKVWSRKFIRTTLDYKKWRLSVFERDKFTCKICGYKGKYLEAHHIEKWSTNFNLRYEIDNGITLCKKCHKEHHRKERIEK